MYGILKSFLENGDKLFFTLVIILVLVNSFSYLLAEHFRNQFVEDDLGGDYLIPCDTYFRCLINTINLGLRGGGGVSDYMILRSNYRTGLFYARFFFDIIFFVFVNLILLGIFFGIIVDSFAAYRDNINSRQKDMSTQCFCCGLSKANLEKSGIDFSEHVYKDHYIWNYYYYIEYLTQKPEVYYDGIDVYVSEELTKNSRD